MKNSKYLIFSKYLLIFILFLSLVSCKKNSNKMEDFRVTHQYKFAQEGADPESGDYLNSVHGMVKNKSKEDKYNINIVFRIHMKDGRIINMANLHIDKLKIDENHQFNIDTTEIVRKNFTNEGVDDIKGTDILIK